MTEPPEFLRNLARRVELHLMLDSPGTEYRLTERDQLAIVNALRFAAKSTETEGSESNRPAQ
jgi:hypothetical protein